MFSVARCAGSRAFAPAAAIAAVGLVRGSNTTDDSFVSCEAPEAESSGTDSDPSNKQFARVKAGMFGGGDEQGYHHGLFPKRQLWHPAKPYPLWDEDWDGRAEEYTGEEERDRRREREIRKNGVTRHIILVRHGQYDETHKEDEKRILTPLGRKQADLTGRRLAQIVKGVDEKFGPCNLKILHVSNLARAKETAAIISKHLPGVEVADPDPKLNEGRPAHNIPGGKARPSVIEKTDECHPRIEAAFERYFYRAPPPEANNDTDSQPNPQTGDVDSGKEPKPKHEFEIIVGHANVIRYFFCRALQLPPEAWLRLCIFNCSLTYLTIRPTGTVSCRMLGDIGHLGYEHSTFSMHHGFNW